MNTAKTTLQSRKYPMVAAILNLIPLSGLVGCYGLEVGRSDNVLLGRLWFFLFFLIFGWGLGYLYIQRRLRFVLAWIAPWVLCPVSFFIRPWDVEHPSDASGKPTTENFIPIFIIVGSAILITAIDALRLASRYNAELGSVPKQSPSPN